jgi:hypothetical protein
MAAALAVAGIIVFFWWNQPSRSTEPGTKAAGPLPTTISAKGSQKQDDKKDPKQDKDNKGSPVEEVPVVRKSIVHQPAKQLTIHPVKGVNYLTVSGIGGLLRKPYFDEFSKQTAQFQAFDLTTGKLLHHLDLPEMRNVTGISLSPDDSRVAFLESSYSNNNVLREHLVHVYSLMDGKALVSNWRPYSLPKENFTLAWEDRCLSWVSLLDNQRLLTMTLGLRLELWTLADLRSLYTKTWVRKNAQERPMGMVDIHSFMPHTFALSNHRKTVAVDDGLRLTLVDTSTGETAKETEPVIEPKAGFYVFIWGVAFRADDKVLAVHATVGKLGGNGDEADHWLVTLEASTGKRLGAVRFQLRNKESNDPVLTCPLSWWGDRHVVLWTAYDRGCVFELSTGTCLCQLCTTVFYHCDCSCKVGRLWYASGEAKGSAYHHQLCMLELPVSALAKIAPEPDGYVPQWWFTEQGLDTQPPPGADGSFTRVRQLKLP